MLIIDPGHGGMLNGKYQTSGKQFHFTSGFSFYEGVFNRELASKIVALALSEGRETVDALTGRVISASNYAFSPVDVPLATRVSNANRHTGVYLSIHANAVGNVTSGPGNDANGFCVYTSVGRSNSDIIADQIVLSMANVQAPVKLRKDMSDGDADHEAHFYVLDKTRMPAILVECGFFTNEQEARWMSSLEGQTLLAHAIYNGIRSSI